MREQKLAEQANSHANSEKHILKQFLQDVISWLVINSMRVDGVQFNLLCEQSVSNIWRKRSFTTLVNFSASPDMKRTVTPPDVSKALQVFRERMDFSIENSVPVKLKYSEKISNLINDHK